MIEHKIDKKIEKGFRRVFFYSRAAFRYYKKEAECLIVGKTFFGLQLYYGKVQLDPHAYWFYIDIPVKAYRFITKYEVIVHENKKPIWQNTIKPSGKFERLI